MFLLSKVGLLIVILLEVPFTQGTQYPTDLLAFQPVFSSSCSNIEPMLQIGTLQAMQMYFVGSKHMEHISSLDFVDVAAMMKKSELWVMKNTAFETKSYYSRIIRPRRPNLIIKSHLIQIAVFN